MSNWAAREHLSDKLRGIPLTACVHDQRCPGNGVRVTHETMLYSALDYAVYAPVNQAAKHLGLTLEYGQTQGKQNHVTLQLYCLRPYASER